MPARGGAPSQETGHGALGSARPRDRIGRLGPAPAAPLEILGADPGSKRARGVCGSRAHRGALLRGATLALGRASLAGAGQTLASQRVTAIDGGGAAWSRRRAGLPHGLGYGQSAY